MQFLVRSFVVAALAFGCAQAKIIPAKQPPYATQSRVHVAVDHDGEMHDQLLQHEVKGKLPVKHLGQVVLDAEGKIDYLDYLIT